MVALIGFCFMDEVNLFENYFGWIGLSKKSLKEQDKKCIIGIDNESDYVTLMNKII